MPRHISLEPHLTIEELEGRYRSTTDPVERSRWHESLKVRVLEHVHLLFVPPHFPWRSCRLVG